MKEDERAGFAMSGNGISERMRPVPARSITWVSGTRRPCDRAISPNAILSETAAKASAEGIGRMTFPGRLSRMRMSCAIWGSVLAMTMTRCAGCALAMAASSDAMASSSVEETVRQVKMDERSMAAMKARWSAMDFTPNASWNWRPSA